MYVYTLSCTIIFIDENVVIDRNEFKNKVFQCVFQYLKRFNDGEDLSNFVYKEPSVEGDYSSCVSIIKKFVSYYT